MPKWLYSKIGVKLLITFSLVLVLSMVSLAYIAKQLIAEFGELSASRNETNIRDNANAFLARIAHEQAMRYENTFKKFAASSAMIAKQSAVLLENMTLYGKTPLKPNEKIVVYPHNGIFSNDRSERTMVLYWGAPYMSEGIIEQINTLSHLDPFLETIKEENPESIACYVVTEPGIARYYPNIHGVDKLPPTTKFDIRNANWYVITKPENNLERKTVWSNIYLDSVDQGLLITASTPVYSKSGQYLGGAGVDITLDTIVTDIFENIPSPHRMNGLFSFLVDNQGRLIAFPPEYLDMFEIKIDRDKLVDATVILKHTLLESSNVQIRKIGESMVENKYEVSRLDLNGQPYIISYHFMPSTGWRLGIVVPESVILASVQETRDTLDFTVKKMTVTFTLVTVFFLIISIIVIVVFSIKSFIRPLNKLSEGALRVQEGELTAHVDIYTKDEIGSLAQSFNSMVDNLRDARDREKAYAENLEQKVEDRTREITIKNEDLKSVLKSLELEISQRQKAEELLRESEKKYRTVFDNTGTATVIIEEDTSISLANSKFEDLTGYARKELEGKKSWTEFVGTEDLERMKKQHELRRKNGNAALTAYEFRIIDRKGDMKDILLTIDMIPGTKQSIASLQDISDHKRLEEEILKAQKLESVGLLAGGIAHDFNNILTTIIGNIAMAKMQVASEDELFEMLSEAEMASLRAQALTKQLLTFAKGGVPVKEIASIRDIIKESCLFVLRGSKSSVEFSISEDLLPAEVDAGQISQVINNIVINANQAMPEGGVIQVKAENLTIDDRHGLPLKPGRYIRIAIKDQGLGISEKHLAKVFDPYFTTKQVGSGLGLTVTYSIIKNHDGHIAVESQLGVGTTFHIYLPASDKAVPEKEEVKLIKGQGTILVMDDDASLRKMVGRILVNLGYEAEVAKDGAEAIRMYKDAQEAGKPYDAVIMDLTIPGGMGGKVAINKLIEIDPEVKAIVSSGYSDDPVLANFQEYGFKGMMPKPFESHALGKVLHEVLQGEKE